MKHLIRISLTALATIALIAVPVSAQSRGGGGSRGGGSHSSGMSHSGGSRSGGYSGGSSRGYSGGYSHSSGSSSRSYGGYSRSSGSSSRSYSYQSRGGSSSQRSSGSVSRQTTPRSSGGSVSRQTAPRTSGGSVSRSGGSSRAVTGGSQRAGISASQAASSRSVAAANARANSIATRGGGSSPREVRVGSANPNVRHIAPRDRRPVPYDRPDRFWHGHHHYFGHRIEFLPPGYVMHHYWGRPYYFYDGFWYRHYHGCYYICRPPFGYVYVPDIIDVAYAACRIAFYCSEINAYNTVNENARTIAEQNAIIAQNNATIAQQNSEIALNTAAAQESYVTANSLGLVQAYADASTEYFYDDGVFFTQSADGKYTVIVPPAGALVTDLPDDYDTITLGGNEYYKVDDTVYELKVVDGTAYFQVLGQLTGELAEQYDLNN